MTEWSEDQDSQLIELIKEGLSASAIANQIGGRSRNAVIGRVHRLSEKLGDDSLHLAVPHGRHARVGVKTTRKRKPRPPRKVKQPEEKAIVEWKPPEVSRPEGGYTVLTRSNWMCKWPIDRVNNQFLFCGQPRKDWGPGSTDETCGPYCEEHTKLAYQPLSARRDIRPDYR